MPDFDQVQLQSMRAAARAFLTNPELAAKTSPQFRSMMLNVIRSSRGTTPRQRHRPANTTGPEGGAA